MTFVTLFQQLLMAVSEDSKKTTIFYIELRRVIIKDDTFEDMKRTYIFSKEHNDRQKDKDDYDLEI